MSRNSSPAANSRIETLPDDLKKIATKLINEKFGLAEEPDDLLASNQKSPLPHTSPWFDPYASINVKTLVYHLKVVGQLFRDGSYGYGTSGFGYFPDLHNLPRTIQFPMYEGTDPLLIADKVNAELRRLEQQFGVKLEAIRV